jgi:hypothetical protein
MDASGAGNVTPRFSLPDRAEQFDLLMENVTDYAIF